jgi:Rhodopirellula transposase DDE domain
VIEAIHRLMDHDTAGDPMTGIRWTRRTTEKIAEELAKIGIVVCANTVAKLLKGLDYRLRVNHKKLSGVVDPGRDAQFAYIATQRQGFADQGQPVVSIDSKKRELVGNFKNPGVTWCQKPTLVNDHDFRSDAEGIALPYGVYDTVANHGCLFVGTTPMTPPSSRSTTWSDGGTTTDGAATPRPTSCSSWPTAAAATQPGPEPGNTAYNSGSATATSSA